jgi:hypothetical protein
LAWNDRTLRGYRLVVLVAFCIVSLAATFWRAARISERNELRDLYESSLQGDLTSVQRMASHHSSEGTSWLEKLAEDRIASADSRSRAIAALGKRRFPNTELLARLLWIDHPFVVRHAAAEVFEQRGCNQPCLSAALYAMHGIWDGQHTAEMRFAAEVASSDHMEALLAQLHSQTEDDYVGLLNKDPSATRHTLKAEYHNASDSAFVSGIEARLRHE